ncbi:restriction endonuclease subunit S [Thalassospira sp. MIT1370]|uniref:restriction endonuclease subunit S n=1 Tax=unclassified Thalassospira TaxID=2648997 RepID=UPI00399BF571
MTVLNDLCELIVDCEHKTAPKSPQGFPSIRTPNVGRGRLILEGANRVDQNTYDRWTRRAVPRTDDLIIAREAPVGNVAIIRAGQQVCLGQRTVLVRPDPKKVYPEFLCYFMLGEYVQGQFQGVSVGATVPHLNMADIRGLVVPPLPNLQTQRRIASILSAYDDLIENNTRRIAILEEMARRLYEEWFVHFRFPGHEDATFIETEDGRVPEGWKYNRLQDFIELAYGKALKAADREEGPYPVFGSSGIVGTHKNYLVEGPGIILGRKGNVGSVHWTEQSFFPIDTVYYVKTELPLEYVFFNLQTQNFLNNDAAVPGLNRNQAYALPFLKPSDELLEKFTLHCKPLYDLVRKLRRKSENLRAQRDLLLPKLISGEITVREGENSLENAVA